MINLSYDLHIHSCLSPCGDDDMTPANIVGMAAVKELDVIALTDHNSCKNCIATAKHAKNYGMLFLPGMELTTIEEVHVLCLFQTIGEAINFDNYVSTKIQQVKNVEEIFGKQSICDERDQVVGREEKLLIQSTNISFDQVYSLMETYHGVMIPAHIDKNSHSVLYNLGFIPFGSQFKSVEICKLSEKQELIEKHRYLEKCLCLKNSDAHYLEQISEPVNVFSVKEKSVEEIFSLLKGEK